MKRILTLFFCLAAGPFLYAANYYVSVSGNDANDGKSISNAFASISRMNQVVLQPGDSILFNRGDLFRGMLQIKQSGTASKQIYVGAYGSGKLPVISGTEIVGNWTNASGNVFQAICADCPDTLQQIFVTNQRHIPARYPNSGYLSVTNADNTAKTFTATALNDAAGTWNGATLYMRTVQWVIDPLHVQSYTSQQITYSIPAHFYTSYPVQNYFGFFLTNKLIALDSAGEWFYDPATKLISMIPVDANALNTAGAEVSVYDNNIRFYSGAAFITIENIQMEKSRKDAVFLNQTANIIINNCIIMQSGRDGVGGFENYSTYNTSLAVKNCLIRDICNTAINLTAGQNILLKGNTIQQIGIIPGLGQGYDAAYDGIFCPSHSKVINNTIDSIGYNGIHVNQYDSVMYNICSNYGLVKNDCGGIYYWQGLNNYVGYNITYDGHGNGDGTVFPNRMMVSGIYSDDYSHNNVIEYNTSYRNETGIMIHNTAYTHVQYNTAYDNRREQLYMIEGSQDYDTVAVHNNQITNNVLQCIHPSQTALLIENSKNTIAELGTFSNNWYCNPYSPDVITIAYTPLHNSGNYTVRYAALTMQQWQTTYNQDLNSHTAYDYPSVYAQYITTGNNLIENSTFSNGIGWWWTYGNAQFTLAAAAAGSHINSASLTGQYQNKQTLSVGNWGIAPVPLSKDKQYLLKYKIAGEQAGGLKVGLNFQDAPSTSETTPVSLCRSYSAQVQQDSILFTSNYTINCSLVFQSSSFDGNFWLDDVTLNEVDADTTMSKPHIISQLFVNNSNAPLTLSTAGNYRNLSGTVVTTNITLQPFTSVVLKDLSAISASVHNKIKTTANVQVYPNPASNRLFIGTDFLSTQATVRIFDLLGEEIYHGLYNASGINLPAQWANGMYILQFTDGDTSSETRFVLNR